MMHERGKSDSAVGALKPANKAERSAAELVEQRAGPRGMRISKARAGLRNGKVCHRRWDAYGNLRRQTPEVRAVCIKVHVRICAGGAG